MESAEQELDGFFYATERKKGVYTALPDGVRVTFELSGAGGGTWTVARDGYGEVKVVRHAVDRPDCRLECSVGDFQALIRGTLNVRKAFLDGHVKVTGDVGLVWRLQKLIVARTSAAER